MDALLTPGARATQLAGERPDEVALICDRQAGGECVLTRLQLEQWANRLAHWLSEAGVGPADPVVINLPNGVEHVVATLAAYKLGGCPTPISHRLPAAERDAMLALALPKAVISDAAGFGITLPEMRDLSRYPAAPPTDATPQPWKAIASGGSTGKPKLIVSTSAFRYAPSAHPFAVMLDVSQSDRVYSPGPLYHNQAFMMTQLALFVGASVVINEKFDAERALAAVERHRPTMLNLVPTMMLRMLRAPAMATRDITSIRKLWHMASACPEWVKRGWIERIGAERIWELWAATEATGATIINGEEWLKHPGSVGKAFATEIRILDEMRRPLPVGEVGEIFTRFGGQPPQCRYVGSAQLDSFDAGFASVGDLGHVDADGYLFLADRRTDLIISGGANIYPAEIEAVLTQLPSVRDAAVIGVKDDDLGRRVHAIIEPSGATAPAQAELDAHVRRLLAGYKVPRSYEIVAALPRDEAGKIRRGSLREARGS